MCTFYKPDKCHVQALQVHPQSQGQQRRHCGLNPITTTTLRTITLLVRFSVKWGSEYQTSLVFKWYYSLYDCWMIQWWNEVWNLDVLSGLWMFRLDFECSVWILTMLGGIWYSIQNQTCKCPVFRGFQISGIWILNRHCILSFRGPLWGSYLSLLMRNGTEKLQI